MTTGPEFHDEGLFRRYPGNPILTPRQWPYRANAVFNPGATVFEDETLLLVRVEDMEGFSHMTVARSKNGLSDWRVDPKPSFVRDWDHKEERWGVEDPRVVWMEELDKYAVCYTSHSASGPVVSAALTKDFQSFERLGVLMPPEDKDASLFPKRIKGRFALIHRPTVGTRADIWISFSPDLKYWGDYRLTMAARPGRWDLHAVGLGAQPVETKEGWLMVYHGVRLTGAGRIYRAGLALLDLEEPWKVIRRSFAWVFGPETSYERVGDVGDVVFPCGAIWDKQTGDLRLYYGAADTTVGVAVGKMDEVMDFLMSSPSSEGC